MKSFNHHLNNDITEYFKSPQLALQKSLNVPHIENIISCHSNLIYGKNQVIIFLIFSVNQLGQTPFIIVCFNVGKYSYL